MVATRCLPGPNWLEPPLPQCAGDSESAPCDAPAAGEWGTWDESSASDFKESQGKELRAMVEKGGRQVSEGKLGAGLQRSLPGPWKLAPKGGGEGSGGGGAERAGGTYQNVSRVQAALAPSGDGAAVEVGA